MKKTLLIHDTFLTKGGAERMNIEIAKILNADIATAVWHENCFDLADFDHDAEVFLTTKNFKKGMIGFLKMKFSFWKFGKKIKSHSEFDKVNFHKKSSLFFDKNSQKNVKDCGSSPQGQKNFEKIYFLSNEASTAVWNLPKNSQKIFYAHSISRHLFDLYDEYLAKVPFFAKIPYRIMAWILKKIYIAELQKFDIILTNSPANQKRLKDWCQVDSFVLFPPVNTEKFRPALANEQGKIFQKFENYKNFLQKNLENKFYISFARVNVTKGIDKIISAFFENPEKKLLIIFGSEDSDRENFQKISGIMPTKKQNTFFQSKKFSNIFWLSLAENEDLPKIISEATATICMSKNEDFGMVAIESMASGIPVIAPCEGGYKETIIDGKTGFLLKENSAENLKKFLQNYDEKNFEKMRENCILQAEKFSLKHFEKNLKNFL